MQINKNPVEDELVCKACGSSHLLRDDEAGELVCQRCGLVRSIGHISMDPEWRAFSALDLDRLPRVGSGLSLSVYDRGLSTMIGSSNCDAFGRLLDPETASRLYRLRKWHRKSQVSDSVERNLVNACAELDRVSGVLGLPDNVVETASFLYRRALSANLIRGRSIQLVVLTCVYIACRQCGVVRTLGDVGASVGVRKRDIARCYRYLLRNLKACVPPSDPLDFVGKVVRGLGLGGDVERVSSMLVGGASELKLTCGRGASSVAAACVYIGANVVGDSRRQVEIAELAQVTVVTLRNRYKELMEYLDIEVYL